MQKLSDLLVKFFPFVLIVVFLAGYALAYMSGVFGNPIRSDGVGYYAYLPSLILHGDPTYQKLAGCSFEGEIPGWTGIQKINDRYLNRYPPGLAILVLPFFCIGHLITLIMQPLPGGDPAFYRLNYPADGFSFFYQHAAGLGGMLLLLTGLILLHGFLLRYFSKKDAALAVLLLVFGTNLLNYGTGETFVVHNGVFLLVVLVIRCLPGWFERPTWSLSIQLGILFGLMALVRSTSLLIIPACILYGIGRLHDGVERIRLVGSRLHFLVAAGFATALLIWVQLFLAYLAHGEWVFNGYARQGVGLFNWTSPRWLQVLFSPRHGALLHAPILIPALFGMAFLRGRAEAWKLPALIFVVGTLYILASWWNWWLGGAFGHRGLIDAYPFLAFGLAQSLSWLRARCATSRLICAVSLLLILLCVLWNLFLFKLYYTRELPVEGFDTDALYDVFWWRWQWLKGFFPG